MVDISDIFIIVLNYKFNYKILKKKRTATNRINMPQRHISMILFSTNYMAIGVY